MPARHRSDWVPRKLRIEVSVDINKSWCNNPARRINYALGFSSAFTNFDDSIIYDSNVG
jgi:hypothetical protein